MSRCEYLIVERTKNATVFFTHSLKKKKKTLTTIYPYFLTVKHLTTFIPSPTKKKTKNKKRKLQVRLDRLRGYHAKCANSIKNCEKSSIFAYKLTISV